MPEIPAEPTADIGESSGPLFAYAGIEVPSTPVFAPEQIKAFLSHRQVSAVLVISNSYKSDVSFSNRQLKFNYMGEVIGVLARSRYKYLDYGVFATFRTHPKCRAAALRIEKGGVYLMGDLVAMTEEEVQSRFRIEDDVLEAMKIHMANDKLRFNMRTPGWHGWALPQRQR